MKDYELDGSELVRRELPSKVTETFDQEWRVQNRKPVDRMGGLTIE